jgi:hypothetical protein
LVLTRSAKNSALLRRRAQKMNPFPGDDMRRPAELAAAAAAGQPWGLAVPVPGFYASPPASPAAADAAAAVDPPAAPGSPAAPKPTLTEAQQASVDVQLCVACRGGDLPKVREALKKGASTTCENAHGWRPLHNAAANGRADAVRALLAAGADIHARDAYGWSALHDAASRGHTDCVCELLKAGADRHLKDKAELTPIHLAKQNAHHAAHDAMANPKAAASPGKPGAAALPKRKRPPKKKKTNMGRARDAEPAEVEAAATSAKKAKFEAPPTPASPERAPAASFEMPANS